MGSSAFAVGGARWCRSELTRQIAVMEPVKHEATWWERCRWWVGVGGSRRRDSSMDIGGSHWLLNSSVSGLVADGLDGIYGLQGLVWACSRSHGAKTWKVLSYLAGLLFWWFYFQVVVYGCVVWIRSLLWYQNWHRTTTLFQWSNWTTIEQKGKP